MFLALPNSAACPSVVSRAAREGNTGAESFYLTFDSAGREKGGVRTFARATKRKRKKKGGGGGRERNERKKREKRQRTGVGGACANARCRVFSHGVAPRRQASSVARRAPLYLHVILHRAARAHGSARSRTFFASTARLISPSYLFFPPDAANALKRLY